MKDGKEAHIRQQVYDLDFDLKAETFVAYLQDEKKLDIAFNDFFKRRFSKDITGISDNLEQEDVLDVTLSRRSFYNIFPERFFHKTYTSTSVVSTMVANYQARLLEQEHAQKFFKPLETEFLLQRVAIEKEENDAFESMGSPELVDFLMSLWQIDQRIPKPMAAKLLKTIPFMYKIAGNLPLLKTVLENIIEEELTITKDFTTIVYQKSSEPLLLGVNMATAGKPKTFLPKYIFTMTDIKKPEQIQDYLPNGKIETVVRFFLRHTLPFECDFEVAFSLPKPKRTFVMNDAVYAGRLGLSATI